MMKQFFGEFLAILAMLFLVALAMLVGAGGLALCFHFLHTVWVLDVAVLAWCMVWLAATIAGISALLDEIGGSR